MLYQEPVRNLKFGGQTMSTSPPREDVFAGESLALSVSQAKFKSNGIPNPTAR